MHVQTHKMFMMAVIAIALSSWPSRAFGAEEYVVVAVEPAADVPKLGTLYAVGDLLHIGQGSTVTLMGDDGSVTALPGPADIIVTADEPGSATGKSSAGSSKLSAISDLLVKGGGSVQSIGASRAFGEATRADLEPWTIPVEDGTTGCIRESRLELWREPGPKAAVSIGYDNQPIVTDLVWEAGNPRMTVPNNVPSGASSAEITIDQRPTRLGLEHLPSDVSLQDHLALYAWMIGSGCAYQASALIRELAGRVGQQ